ncbi:hypothetical protein M8J75_011721 [Diaphorina citri]|nr:hypothetical protein M8J75_011721 [Diaphorina citri]
MTLKARSATLNTIRRSDPKQFPIDIDCRIWTRDPSVKRAKPTSSDVSRKGTETSEGGDSRKVVVYDPKKLTHSEIASRHKTSNSSIRSDSGRKSSRQPHSRKRHLETNTGEEGSRPPSSRKPNLETNTGEKSSRRPRLREHNPETNTGEKASHPPSLDYDSRRANRETHGGEKASHPPSLDCDSRRANRETHGGEKVSHPPISRRALRAKFDTDTGKDPSRPPRLSRNPYMNFYLAFLRADRTQLPVSQIARSAGLKWNAMGDAEKQKYRDMARQARLMPRRRKRVFGVVRRKKQMKER